MPKTDKEQLIALREDVRIAANPNLISSFRESARLRLYRQGFKSDSQDYLIGLIEGLNVAIHLIVAKE